MNNPTWKTYEALNWASSFLKKKGREPKAGELLLMHRLGGNRTHFLMMMREELKEEDVLWFQSAVERHGTGVPIQHIIGYEQFYGRVFEVSEDVLIPRPETEELVQGILKLRQQLFPQDEHVTYCDVGTGSGVIALTLALEDSKSDVTAVDLSPAALKMARKNANRLEAEANFVKGDLLMPFIGEKRFDIIVSNPPYIPSATVDTLDDVVKDHEPRLALDGGEDGLAPYRIMARQLPEVVSQRFLIGFEIGEGQGQAVMECLSQAFSGRIQTEIRNDLNGRERMVFAWSQLK